MGEYQRWMAEITYTDGTPPEVVAVEELFELQRDYRARTELERHRAHRGNC